MTKPRNIARRAALGLIGIGTAATFLSVGRSGAEAPFPSRVVWLVVPFPAGGITDIVGRIVAQELTKRWGRQVVVDNKAGGSGVVGSAHVSRANPDGYTLLLGNDSPLITVGLLNPPPAYDPLTAFSSLGAIARANLVLAAHRSLPAKSVQEVVDYARKNPGKLSIGSSGSGNTSRLLAEMFKMAAGIDIVQVPSNGSAALNMALLRGEVQLAFVSTAEAAAILNADSSPLVVLATPARQRLSQMPAVPTMAEVGYPDVLDESMFGLLGPPGMAQGLVEKINHDLRASLDTDEVHSRLLELGYTVAVGEPGEYLSALADTMMRKKRIIDAAGIASR